MSSVRNRIKDHRRVRAGDLVPHELNFRTHPDEQREALLAIYQEVGFARSLLAYELPDGRLKLIDGHLRQDLNPDMEVDVEVLDVDDAEARKLLLSIDPFAELAGRDEEALAKLRAITAADSAVMARAWEKAHKGPKAAKPKESVPQGQFLLLLECESEEHQVALLKEFHQRQLKCKALMS